MQDKVLRFNAIRPRMKTLRELGAEEFLRIAPGRAEAFRKLHLSACMDERLGSAVAEAYRLEAGGLFREDAEQIFQDRHLNAFCTHDGCAAAKGVWQQSGSTMTLEEFQEQRAKEISARTGIKHIHITADQMKGPAEYHDAGCIILSAVDFSPVYIPELPFALTLHENFAPVTDQALPLAGAVAFQHGFGELFTEVDSLPIIIIGDSSNPKFDAQRLLTKAREVFKPYGNRVWIDGFNRPSDWQAA